MKFIVGFVVAIVAIIVTAALMIVTGIYNVAATVPHTALERTILATVMFYSVRSHAGSDVDKSWNEDQIRLGFEEYDAMCIHCHGAPGKEASEIGKGLRPAPPNLAETGQRWNNAELFWIVKNGIRMSGMPAFAPMHTDDTLWNIVGFVRDLPRLSAEDYRGMQQPKEPHEHHH